MSKIENVQRLAVDLPMVSGLVGEQFPELSKLPISPLSSTGTENAVFRLGKDALIRLPTTPGAAEQVDKEQRWLPEFAKVDLPLAIPKLLEAGVPNQEYPYNWSIYNWLKGKPATTERITDIDHAAELLGQFVATFQTIDTEGAPAPGTHNFHRGVPLAERDDMMQDALRRLHADGFDTRAVSREWDEAVATPAWEGAPVWLHGDLADSNMLAKRRRKKGDKRELNAVIDFGGAAVGDPACDIFIAWDVVDGARDIFFAEAQPDQNTINRGRGWAVSTAAISLVRFPDQPAIKNCALRKINEVIADRSLD